MLHTNQYIGFFVALLILLANPTHAANVGQNASLASALATASDLSLKWDIPFTSNLSAPVLGHDGTVYLGSTDGKLYAIKTDGLQKWIYVSMSSAINNLMVGADGTIYATTGNKLIAIDKNSGILKWEYADISGTTLSLAANGIIYADAGSSLLAINPDGKVISKYAYEHCSHEFCGFVSYGIPWAIGGDGTVFTQDSDYGWWWYSVFKLNPSNGIAQEMYRVWYNDLYSASLTLGVDGSIYFGVDMGYGIWGVW